VSPESRLKVAVVGLGYWGPNLLRVLADDVGTEIVWLCDLDEGRLQQYGARHPGASLSTSFEDVLGDDRVDAVFIATPVFSHYELATASLRAGKHTFVEKPLAPSVAQADELIALSLEHERVLMCGHTFIYSPPVRAVKQLIDDGELGDIYFLSSSRVNLGLHQRDVSVVWDLGPHDFSILTYWLGETPSTIRGVGRDAIVPGVTDVAFLTLNFPSGILANVELSWLAPSKLRRTVVVGSERMLIYEDGAPEPLRVYDHGVVYQDPETFGQYHLSYRTGAIVSPKVDSYEPLAAELEDFVRAARAGSPLAQNLALARDVVLVTAAAAESLTMDGGFALTERVR
jgi:predicted dehydrogenase